MGTDIQYFADTWIGGQWKPAFGDFHSTEDDQELSHRNKFYFDGDRNYELLEILVYTIDPRSGHIHRGFQPISSPRGIPADVSPVIQRIDEHRSKGSSRRYRMRQEAHELLVTV